MEYGCAGCLEGYKGRVNVKTPPPTTNKNDNINISISKASSRRKQVLDGDNTEN